MKRENNGILVIDKPVGLTSHDCVSMVRKVYNIKKVGHAGTLDPVASGVMVLFVGNATRMIEYYGEDYKEYECGFKLGFSTDTYDITGQNIDCSYGHVELLAGDEEYGKSDNLTDPIKFKKDCECFEDYVLSKIENSKAKYCKGRYSKLISEKVVSNISKEQVESALLNMIGINMQEPPAFSALKLNGKKLYEYAREGKKVEPRPREVDIKEIELLKFDETSQAGSFKALVSKGTYVRSICNDLGKALGSGACMTSLVRTKSGRFNLDNAVRIIDITEDTELHRWDAGLSDFGRVSLDTVRAQGFRNGLNLEIAESEMRKPCENAGKFKRHYVVECREDKVLLGMAELTADNFIKRRKVVCGIAGI